MENNNNQEKQSQTNSKSDDDDENSILRPDIHSQLNELLSPETRQNAPTTLFVDNLLNNTYNISPPSSSSAEVPSSNQEEQKPGPLSLLYNKPYSISPNNLYQSIVITQLNDQIKSKDDIDIQVIYPNELHLIATGKSLSNCTQYNNALAVKPRSKSTSNVNRTTHKTTTTTTTVTKIELDEDLIITQMIQNQPNDLVSTECQTDIHLDPTNAFTRNVCTPSLAETESISFYYIDEAERLRQLESMLSDNYYSNTNDNSDPCVEFESYLRGRTSNGSNSNPVSSSHVSSVQSRSRANSSPRVKYETASTQTFLSALNPIPDDTHRSTQTSPELLRRYLSTLTPLESPDTENKPLIRAKTVAVIHTAEPSEDNELRNRVRETFTIRDRTRLGEGVQYAQVSEYKTDLISNSQVKITDAPLVKIHESIVIKQDEEEEKDKKQKQIEAEIAQLKEAHLARLKEFEVAKLKEIEAKFKDKLKDQTDSTTNTTSKRPESVEIQARKKLGHSTIEITQVTNNTTSVTGLSLGGNTTDRFSMSVNMPSVSPTGRANQPSTEPIENNPQEEYTSNKVIDVIVQSAIKPEPSIIQQAPTPPPTPVQSDSSKPSFISVKPPSPIQASEVKSSELTKKLPPPPLPKSLPASKPPPSPPAHLALNNKYMEDTYDPKFVSKRKPIILECNDPQLKELDQKIDTVQSASTGVVAQQQQAPSTQPVNTIHKQLVKPPPVVNRVDIVRSNNDLSNPIVSRLNMSGFKQPAQQQQPPPSPSVLTQMKPATSRRSIISSSSSSILSAEDTATTKTKSIESDMRKPSVITLSESSKLSFNTQDPEILDIDFDVYEKNAIERQVHEVELDENDNIVDRTTMMLNESDLPRAELSKTLITDMSNVSKDVIDIDLSVYDEEPRVIGSSSQRATPSPTVYSHQYQQQQQQQMPARLPPAPIKARQSQTKLSTSSVSLSNTSSTNFAKQEPVLTPKKLYSDWQNLIQDVEPQNAPLTNRKNYLLNTNINSINNNNNTNKNFQSNLSLNFEEQKRAEKLEYTVGGSGGLTTSNRGPTLSMSSTVSGVDTGVETDIDEEFTRMNKRTIVNRPRGVVAATSAQLLPPTNQFNQRLPQSLPQLQQQQQQQKKLEPRREFLAAPQRQQPQQQQQLLNQVSLVPVSTEIFVDTEPNITSDLNLIRNLRSKFKTQQIASQQQQQQQQQKQHQFEQSETAAHTEKVNKQSTAQETSTKEDSTKTVNNSNNNLLKSIQIYNKQQSNSITHNASLDLENNTNNLVATTSSVPTNNSINQNGVQYSSLSSLTNFNNNNKQDDDNNNKTLDSHFKQFNFSLDSSGLFAQSTKMQKIMNSTAEKEYQKLLRRIERRRVRVPQILEQLEKTKNTKEKRKLEEELRVLLRKSERDNVLLARYQAMFQAYQNSSRTARTDDEDEADERQKLKSPRSRLAASETNLESASMTSFSTMHSQANLASANSLAHNETATEKKDEKDLEESKKKYKTRTMARESGYSSCGDESGPEHVHQLNKEKNESLESILQHDEEEDLNVSPIKSAIKSSVVDKILISSSNFIVPKAPNLRISNKQQQQNIPQIQPRQRIQCNDTLNRQTSKLDDLMIEVPQVDIMLPSEITVNSGGSQHRMASHLASEDRLSIDAPDDHYDPNRPQRNLFPSSSGYSGRSVPLGSVSSSGSGSYRAVPANTSANIANTSQSATSRQLPHQQATSTPTASSINISPINNNVQSTASSSLIRPPSASEPAPTNLDEFTVEYISESSLGENYMQTYQVQQDPSTDVNNNYVDENNNNSNANVVSPQEEEENRIVEYIEEADLAGITDAETAQDPLTGETLIYHRNNPVQQWVVLPSNWRELNYVAREDIDTTNLDVYVEPGTRRKFVVDEKNNKFYLVDSIGMSREFKEKWAYFSHLKPQQQQVASPQPLEARLTSIRSNGSQATPINSGTSSPDYTAQPKLDEDEDDFYIDEVTLQEVDLTNAKLVHEGDEVILYHSANPNERWVVLPDGWRVDENANYVDENDIDLLDWDVFVDETSKRRYVTDDKTGQRFYIVKYDVNKFKKRWHDLVHMQEKLNPKPHERPAESPTKRITFDPDIPDYSAEGLSEQFRNEPSTFKLRSSLKNSPERDNNLPLKKLNTKPQIDKPPQTKLIIKQPGKPGHLINGQKNQLKPQQQQQQQKQPSKSISPVAKDAKRTLQQQNALRAQQEAARRAFLNQKMPSVGKLWIHQMLIDNQRKVGDIRARISQSTDHRSEEEEEEMNRNRKHWKSLTHLNDPTMDAESAMLDRNRLADVQIYGYNKYDKKIQARERIDYNEDTYNAYWKDLDTQANSKSNIGFGGGDNTFVRGVLTEDFRRNHYYTIQQMNSRYRALVPTEYCQLKQQFLLTPRYLKDSWEDTLNKSYKLKPRIILINDNERILTANKNCNVYVQFDYDNDSVLGANPMYQFMLPDCGPVAPTRPLLITPGKVDKLSKKLVPPGRQVDIALREAPVFVYHKDGSAYFENIAQYLAGRYPQLSPQTARKILQFADMREFEDYLASKITREEAKRISAQSGSELIDVAEIKKQLLKSVTPGVSNVNNNSNKNEENSVFLHRNCEYDPLRNVNELSAQQQADENTRPLQANDTHEVKIGNHQFKSTLIGFKPTGQVEKLKYEDLPVEVRRALQQMPQLEKKFFSDSNRKKIIPKP